MSRKSLKKKSSEILRLKILLEDKDIAEEELDIGTRELTQILKDYSLDISQDQKKKYNDFFFGDLSDVKHNVGNSSNVTTISILKDTAKNVLSNVNNKKQNHLPWVKKLYKQIVQRSHPDKYIDFPIKEIKEKYTKIYMNTVDALAANDIGLLLLCAYEVELKVEEPSAKVYIAESSKKYKNKIDSIMKLIGYQWYHIPDENRVYFLEKYLSSLGFVFDKNKTDSIIKNNRIKRSPGTRPPKIRKNIS